MSIRRSLPVAVLGLLALLSPAVRADVISLDSEIRIGREVASEVERELPLSRDPILIARVERIGRRLAMVSGRPELPFEFHVIDAKEINAFALPGGIIYMYRGLLQALPNDEALAFVMGHEITHATRRHALRQFKKNTLVEILSLPLRKWLGVSGRDWLRLIMQQMYSRDDESEADRIGMEITARAGFSPDGGPQAMETLLKMFGKGGPKILILLQDHPATDARLKKLRAKAEQLKSARVAETAGAGETTLSPISDGNGSGSKEPIVQPAPFPPLPSETSAKNAAAADCSATDGLFPLAVGNRWLYRVTDDAGARSQVVVKVLEQTPSDHGNVFRIERKLDRTVVVVNRVAALSSVVFRLKGCEWETEWRFESGREFRVVGEESVTIPNGTYTALHVERLSPDGKPIAIAWFVKGIGLVKRQSLTTGITEALEVYEVAK